MRCRISSRTNFSYNFFLTSPCLFAAVKKYSQKKIRILYFRQISFTGSCCYWFNYFNIIEVCMIISVDIKSKWSNISRKLSVSDTLAFIYTQFFFALHEPSLTGSYIIIYIYASYALRLSLEKKLYIILSVWIIFFVSGGKMLWWIKIFCIVGDSDKLCYPDVRLV